MSKLSRFEKATSVALHLQRQLPVRKLTDWLCAYCDAKVGECDHGATFIHRYEVSERTGDYEVSEQRTGDETV